MTEAAVRRQVIANKVLKECAAGASVVEAARRNDLSERTVTRILQAHRAAGEQIEIKKGRPLRTRLPYELTRGRSAPEDGVDPVQINNVYRSLRNTPVPYPAQLGDEALSIEVEKLRRMVTTVDERGEIRPQSGLGLRVCTPFFPNRYHATWKSNMSAAEGWRNEVALKKAIRFQLAHGDPVVPKNVLRALCLAYRTPTIFRPGVALHVYRAFCPPGGRVWDPCAGFGGRLLGAHAAGVQYTGTDVDVVTVEGNRKLAERLGANYDVVVSPAENFDPPEVDLVFTSPPYFDRERYSSDKNQTWKKHGKSLDSWLEGFLRPVVERARDALDARGHLVLNIADLNDRGTVIPLVSRTIELAIEAGFVHVQTLLMPLAAVNKVRPAEPVLVFRPA